MEMKAEKNRIFVQNEEGKEIACVEYPALRENRVDLVHTAVDPSLRGKGVAGRLMECFVEEMRSSGREAVLTCSFAVDWFSKHPEYKDVLVQPEKVYGNDAYKGCACRTDYKQ